MYLLLEQWQAGEAVYSSARKALPGASPETSTWARSSGVHCPAGPKVLADSCRGLYVGKVPGRFRCQEQVPGGPHPSQHPPHAWKLRVAHSYFPKGCWQQGPRAPSPHFCSKSLPGNNSRTSKQSEPKPAWAPGAPIRQAAAPPRGVPGGRCDQAVS